MSDKKKYKEKMTKLAASLAEEKSMDSIVDKFKHHARELSKLYKTRRELDEIILHYEHELKGLGQVLEFADSVENSYRNAKAPPQG